ncbi:Scr1 family TA system antitoxin-like transcriptional regulator [Streptomyces diastatochromogenes]|uniref:Scr1 family TA system antitoxin-like transcriptional regulator n=1 Tax=Streptomyces diastatochromogenes TaxID=42236 RepID=UPI0036CC2DAD
MVETECGTDRVDGTGNDPAGEAGGLLRRGHRILPVGRHAGLLSPRGHGTEVMRAQLAHLVEASRRPNVRLQVVPYIAGSHPGMTSAFSIVSFAEPGAMDVVYMDTTSSTLWLKSEADADRHNATFERIARSGLALRDSTALIERIRKEL